MGFVTDDSTPAGEYHCRDFDPEDVLAVAQERLEQQRREREEADPNCTETDGNGRAGATNAPGDERAASHAAASTLGPDDASDASATGSSPWEGFYREHRTGLFFKERRYLLLEFPELAAIAKRGDTVAEIGCGNGSTLVPLLKAGAGVGVAVDISPSAVRLSEEAAVTVGLDRSRVRGHVCDMSDRQSEATRALIRAHGEQCAAVLAVFVLSALDSKEAMIDMLRAARDLLTPGGLLLFRDYGENDMVMLRFHGSQWLSDRLYRRSDGTLAYFFRESEVAELMREAGFEVEECEYHCVENVNRKKGKVLRRIFVHAVGRKVRG